MFCPKCGLQLQAGTNFCPRCGTPLNPQYNQPPAMQQPSPPQPDPDQLKESVSDGIVKGCGAFILAILIIVVAVFIVLSVER